MKQQTFFVRLCLCLGICAIQMNAIASPTKSEALEKIRTGLAYITNQVNIQDADFSIIKEDQFGIELSGVATLFGVSNVNVQATIGQLQHSINLIFPKGVSTQIQIADQTLSSWLPNFLQNKLDLTNAALTIFPKENNRILFNANLSQPNSSSLIDYGGLKVSQPNLLFSLAKSSGTNPQTQVSAGLTGKLKLAGLNFDLAATVNNKKEWTIAGILNELKINDLVRNVGAFINSPVPPMPQPIESFTIQQASLVIENNRAIRLKGICDLGRIETYLLQQNKQFLLGITPNTGYKLARISQVLQPIDQLGLTDVALVYATNSGRIEQELELLNGMQLGSQNVKAGVTLMGGFDLPDNLPGMTQKGKVIMRATLPPSLTATPTLQAIMQFNGLQLGSDFRVNESFIQLAPVDLSFGAGLSLGAKLDSNWINFTGMGDIAAPATFALAVFMEQGSIWKNPFGIKGIEIADLGLDVGADVLSPLPRPKLGVSGSLKVGPFQGQGAGMLDTGNPLNSLISLKMNEIGMQQFINAFLNNAIKNEFNKLPATVRDYSMKNAELTIIPKTTEMAGRTYTQGLRLAGQANIIGLAMRLDINAGFDNGYKGEGVVAPILWREGNTTIFSLTGNQARDSARVAIDMTYSNLLNPKQPFYLIDGKVSLLGMSSQTKVEINKNGVYFYTEGNLFGKFQARLDAQGGSFNDLKGFYIRAAMRNDLISYLNKEATAEIDKATKATQNEYAKAKKDLKWAEDYLRSSQDAVNAFNVEKRKVDDAQREVDKLKKNLDSANRSCKKGNVGKCFEVAGIEVAYNTAKGTLWTYKQTLTGLSAAVDWGQREVATRTLAAARSIVDGFDKATTGSLAAAKWIVDKGLGGVLDVKSAEFAGKLDVMKGGVVSMKANVKFLDNNHNASFTFNFTDPVSGAKALASMLLDNKAPKGHAPEFGGQIGQKNYDATSSSSNSNAVTLYQNFDFGGASVTLAEGRHDINTFYSSIGNDQLSSIRIPSGYRVTLYEHGGFQGRTQVLTSDVAAISGFNDMTSSIVIEKMGHVQAGKYYKIQARHSGKLLYITGASTTNGATLVQYEDHGGSNNQFLFEDAGSGYYVLKAKHSSKALDVKDSTATDGQPIIQWDIHNGANQQFRLDPAGDGYYFLVAKHSQKLWDVNGSSAANSAGIIQWTKHGGANQQFKLIAVD